MFVLVLNIQAPGAVKHQCSPLMEKGGCKGHSSEGRERRSQASSLVEDLLELSKGYSEKMHLGLFNPNEGCLAYRFYLCHCHWCFPAVLWVSLRTTPTVPCAPREPGWSCSSTCASAGSCCAWLPGTGMQLSQSRLCPLLEQGFRLGHQCQMRSQGVLPVQDMLKGNLISLTCSSRFYIEVTFCSLPFPLQF